MESTTFKGNKYSSQFKINLIHKPTLKDINLLFIDIEYFEAVDKHQSSGVLSLYDTTFLDGLESKHNEYIVTGSITYKDGIETKTTFILRLSFLGSNDKSINYALFDMNHNSLNYHKFTINPTSLIVILKKNKLNN